MIRRVHAIAILGGLVGSPLCAEDASQQAGLNLHLVCAVEGTRTFTEDQSVFAHSNAGNVEAVGTSTSRGDFQDEVELRLVAGVGQIRLPRQVLPPLHGGDGGWFDLGELRVTSDDIDAVAKVNFASHPKIHINRVTGVFSLHGKRSDFGGPCTPYDSATVQRKF